MKYKRYMILMLLMFLGLGYAEPLYHIPFNQDTTFETNTTNSSNSLNYYNSYCRDYDDYIVNCSLMNGIYGEMLYNNIDYSGTQITLNRTKGFTFVLSLYWNFSCSSSSSGCYLRVTDKNYYYFGYKDSSDADKGITTYWKFKDLSGNECYSNNYFNYYLQQGKKYILMVSVKGNNEYLKVYNETKDLVYSATETIYQDYGNCNSYPDRVLMYYNQLRFESYYYSQPHLEPFGAFDEFLIYDEFKNDLTEVEQDFYYSENSNNGNQEQNETSTNIIQNTQQYNPNAYFYYDAKELLQYIIDNFLLSKFTSFLLFFQVLVGFFAIFLILFKS